MEYLLTTSNEGIKKMLEVERQLYTLLAFQLEVDPFFAIQLVAFILWLERLTSVHLIPGIHSLSHSAKKLLLEEAANCLTYLKQITTTNPSDSSSTADYKLEGVPLLERLTDSKVTLTFLKAVRETALQGINDLLTQVCFRAFHDLAVTAILKPQKCQKKGLSAAAQPFYSRSVQAQQRSVFPWPAQAPLTPARVWEQQIISEPQEKQLHPTSSSSHQAVQAQEEAALETHPNNRSVVVTFSKQNPVNKFEVWKFLTSLCDGDNGCVVGIGLQKKENVHSNWSYLVVTLKSVSTIDLILKGAEKVEFTVDGKDVWIRKFVVHNNPHKPPRLPIKYAKKRNPEEQKIN